MHFLSAIVEIERVVLDGVQLDAERAEEVRDLAARQIEARLLHDRGQTRPSRALGARSVQVEGDMANEVIAELICDAVIAAIQAEGLESSSQ